MSKVTRLETDRWLLMEIQMTDYEDIKKLYMDEKVRKYLGGTVNEDRYKKSFLAMMKGEAGDCYWTVRDKESNDFIALVSIDTHHDGVSKEISYQFVPEYWGKGYGREVIGRILDYCFGELKLSRVVAETQSANMASFRLLSSLGMQVEETVVRFGAEQKIFTIQTH